MKRPLIPELKEDGNYYFVEEVNIGIINGSCPSYSRICSVWNKDQDLISITVDHDDFTSHFVNKKEDLKAEWNYNRAKLAINRHKKALRIFLGIEKPVELKRKDFITIGYFFQGELDFINLPLTKEGNPNLRELGRFTNSIVEETPRLREIAESYNEKVRELNIYRKQVFEELFKK